MPRVTYTLAGEPDVVMYYMQTKSNYHYFSVARDNAIYMAWVSNSDVWSNNRYIYEKQSNRVNSFTVDTASNQTYPTTKAVYDFCVRLLYDHTTEIYGYYMRIISSRSANFKTSGITSPDEVISCFVYLSNTPLANNAVPATLYREWDGYQYNWVLAYQSAQSWVYTTVGTGVTLYATRDDVFAYFSGEYVG